jgi:hypothetical protein
MDDDDDDDTVSSSYRGSPASSSSYRQRRYDTMTILPALILSTMKELTNNVMRCFLEDNNVDVGIKNISKTVN